MSEEALKRLASFAPNLRTGTPPFVQFAAPEGDGSDEAPYVLGAGHDALTDVGIHFVETAYDAGWVLKDFDWSGWAETNEGRNFLNGRAGFTQATAEQLARTLTALLRKDRFAEGTLAEAFRNGTILSICERAEKLCH